MLGQGTQVTRRGHRQLGGDPGGWEETQVAEKGPR